MSSDWPCGVGSIVIGSPQYRQYAPGTSWSLSMAWHGPDLTRSAIVLLGCNVALVE